MTMHKHKFNARPTWHDLIDELSSKQTDQLRYWDETEGDDRNELIDAALAFIRENRAYSWRGPNPYVVAAELASHLERTGRITFAEMDEFMKLSGVNMFGFFTLTGQDVAQAQFEDSMILREGVSAAYVEAAAELFREWPVNLTRGDSADFASGDEPWWVTWVKDSVNASAPPFESRPANGSVSITLSEADMTLMEDWLKRAEIDAWLRTRSVPENQRASS